MTRSKRDKSSGKKGESSIRRSRRVREQSRTNTQALTPNLLTLPARGGTSEMSAARILMDAGIVRGPGGLASPQALMPCSSFTATADCCESTGLETSPAKAFNHRNDRLSEPLLFSLHLQWRVTAFRGRAGSRLLCPNHGRFRPTTSPSPAFNCVHARRRWMTLRQ